MPVTLTIKNVPDALAEALRRRAQRNHRSLQGELMALLEGGAGLPPEKLTPREILDHVRSLGVEGGPPYAVDIIRQDRDSR